MYRILVGLVLLSPISAQATEDFESANYLLPKCKMVQKPNMPQDNMAGLCLGVLLMSKSVGPFLEGSLKTCVPHGVTQQMNLMVAKYLEERPAQLHQPFVLLANDAIQAAWPCKK